MTERLFTFDEETRLINRWGVWASDEDEAQELWEDGNYFKVKTIEREQDKLVDTAVFDTEKEAYEAPTIYAKSGHGEI